MHATDLQTAPLKSRRRPKVRTGKFSDFPQNRTGTNPPVAEKPASAKSLFGAKTRAGTCIREKVLDATDNVTDTKYYAWGLDLSQSTQGAGGVGGLVAMMDGDAGTTYYYAYDANGNVGQLVDGSDDSIAARYEYDAFGGEIVADGVMAGENAYRFSTKYFIPELGVYDYGYRLYGPQLGRWLNRDPMGEEGGLQLYSFLANNPLNDVDVLGQVGLFGWISQWWNSLTGNGDAPIESTPRTPQDLVREQAADEIMPRDVYNAGSVPDGQGEHGWHFESPWGDDDKGFNYYYLDKNSGEMVAFKAYTECQRQLLQKYFGPDISGDYWFDGPIQSVPSPIDFVVLGNIGTSVVRASVRALTGKIGGNAFRVSHTVYGSAIREEASVGYMGDAAGRGQRLLTTGNTVPNAGGKITSFVTQQEKTYYRVYSGDSTRGSFLTLVKPRSSAYAREALALPPGNQANYVQEVFVPAGVRLQRSRALPAFGHRGGAEQFQLLEMIPNSSFGSGVPFK